MSNRQPVIVIDPGHGGKNKIGGSSPNNAVGPNGLLEKNLTLDVSKRLKALLANGADVSLTRTDDSNLSLTDRAKAAADRHADVFVSLHFNGFNDARVDGSEVWVARQASNSSRGLAQKMLSEVVAATGVSNRGIRESDFGVLLPSRHASNTAACLVETAFLTNTAQARHLESETYRQQIAAALAEGVSAYLKSTQLPAVPASATLDYEAAGWGAALSGTSLSRAARLEWQDQTLVPDSHGRNTLFLLTTGSPEGGPAVFNLKVTNTNDVYNLKSTMLKVRLRRREGEGTA